MLVDLLFVCLRDVFADDDLLAPAELDMWDAADQSGQIAKQGNINILTLEDENNPNASALKRVLDDDDEKLVHSGEYEDNFDDMDDEEQKQHKTSKS